MIGEDSNPPRNSGGGMNLEVWFPQQNEVSVFLESSIGDPDEEQFYETCLFGLYAARQIANLGREGGSLAFVLQTTDTLNPLAQTLERLDEVRVGSPRHSGGGRKGFTCQLRPEKRAFFKLDAHGFGMLGKGAGYYAPTSTLALLYWLLERRKDDPVYQRALAATAENVGILGMRGQITVTTQAPLAMEATTAAWAEAREQALLPDDLELSEAAREACEENDINFAALFAGAAGRLRESLSEMEGEGFIALPDEVTRRMCQLEVITAADLEEDERIERAFNAVQAADATEDAAMIEAAYSHYDKALAEVIGENDLEPVVQALDGALFTRDPDRAAEL
ncbi:MAG TPA: hypothetical protein VFA19_14115 [Gaiellaceae bacterium]|nr:hypothetical protein [Gaiellaceae bacterium]